MLFVSHDRAFLRGLSNRVVELGGETGVETQPHLYQGSYDEYVARTGMRRRGCTLNRDPGSGTRDSGSGVGDSAFGFGTADGRPGTADYRVFAIARTPPSENWAMCCAIRSSSRSVMVFGRSAATGCERSARHCA